MRRISAKRCATSSRAGRPRSAIAHEGCRSNSEAPTSGKVSFQQLCAQGVFLIGQTLELMAVGVTKDREFRSLPGATPPVLLLVAALPIEVDEALSAQVHC